MKMNKGEFRINGTVFLVMFLFALFLLPAFSYAALVGNNIPIASYAYNQQNPDTVYLPDQNLWFVVWEDWRNHFGTKADIWGQFIDQNGQLCGSEFQLTNVSTGNQTMPRAAYRYGDKIVVVWQDTRANYVYYTAITSFPTVSSVSPLPAPPANCSYSPPAATLGTQISFTGTEKWNPHIVTNVNSVPAANLAYGDGTSVTYSGNILSPVVPGTLSVNAGGQIMSDSGTGILLGTGGHGAVNYATGFVTVTFAAPVLASTPIVVTYQYDTYTYTWHDNVPATSCPTIPGDQVCDTLSSRTSPRIAYDPVNDFFWVAWIEGRSTLNRQSEVCWYKSANWTFGDNKFPGYVALSGPGTPPLAEQQNAIGVNGADIIRNDVSRTNRLIAKTIAPLTETYEYEFFTQINNITLDSDTISPATFLAWEGVRQKALVTCTCTDANGNGICDPGEVITSTLQVSNYDDGNVHIYSLFDDDISQPVVYSMKLDSATGDTAHNPALAFDPITERFLSAWEDMRGGADANNNDANTKIYGQIIQSGGGLYNSDFIISYSDFASPGQNDSNVASSKQTSPYISYDGVNQRYFVVWQDGRNGSISLENLDIYGQKVDAEGSLEGSNYAIVTQPFDQYRPAIAYNDVTNQFLAVWKDARNADISTCGSPRIYPCGADVYGQIFSLGNPALTLLNPNNTPLAPPLLNNFQNPAGSGIVQVGLSATQSFIMRNTGDTTLNIYGLYQNEPPSTCPPSPATSPCSGVALTDSVTFDITPFSFDGLPLQLESVCDLNNIQLVPGAQLALTVRFTPVAGGSYNCFFKINSDGGNLQVNVSALSTEADIEIASPLFTASGMTFTYPITVPGGVNIGNYEDQTFVVKNIGVANLIISTLGPPSSPFSIQSDACSGQTVAPGATCNIVVRFTPTAPVTSPSSFTINSSAVNYSAFIVNLSGTGVGAPNINVSPVTINFGNVQVGQTSPGQTVTITNNGTQTLNLGPISVPTAPFTMTNPCSATLSVGASCQLTVQVKPTGAGSIGGTITIKSNDPVKGAGVVVSLTATGVTTPQIGVNPAFVNFPSTPVGSTATQTITVTSAGSANLQITGITNPSPDFSITGSTCSGSFIPGATCTITVSFAPSKTGIQNSSFTISSNDPVTPSFTVNLSGTGSSSGGGGGLPPSIQASPMLVDFGLNVNAGTIAGPKTVTVTNTGAGNLVIGTIQYPGKPYTVTSDTCKGQTIAPTKSCTLAVIFNPTRSVYYYPYYIIINSNDPITPALKITLRGM